MSAAHGLLQIKFVSITLRDGRDFGTLRKPNEGKQTTTTATTTVANVKRRRTYNKKNKSILLTIITIIYIYNV